jgi:hypothetical protein
MGNGDHPLCPGGADGWHVTVKPCRRSRSKKLHARIRSGAPSPLRRAAPQHLERLSSRRTGVRRRRERGQPFRAALGSAVCVHRTLWCGAPLVGREARLQAWPFGRVCELRCSSAPQCGARMCHPATPCMCMVSPSMHGIAAGTECQLCAPIMSESSDSDPSGGTPCHLASTRAFLKALAMPWMVSHSGFSAIPRSSPPSARCAVCTYGLWADP